MICPACNSHPSRLCPEHAQTENLSDSVDAELERLREENRELTDLLVRIQNAWIDADYMELRRILPSVTRPKVRP